MIGAAAEELAAVQEGKDDNRKSAKVIQTLASSDNAKAFIRR